MNIRRLKTALSKLILSGAALSGFLFGWTALGAVTSGTPLRGAASESQVGKVVEVAPGWLVVLTEQGFQLFERGHELTWSLRPIQRGDRVWLQARSRLERLEILEGPDQGPGLQRELPGQVPLPSQDWTDERGYTSS